MRRAFSKGVYAQVTLKSKIELKENGEVKFSESHYFADSGSVYDFLIDYAKDETDADIIADAESWTELASVGEIYENDNFEIEMVER